VSAEHVERGVSGEPGSPARSRGFTYRPDLVPSDYPIAEVFGYSPGAQTESAADARDRCWCPFRDKPCTKLLSGAGTGICSVRYRAQGFDEGIWAVCANRLAGAPFRHVLDAHFGDKAEEAVLISEVRIDDPAMSFDGIGLRELAGGDVDFVGVEAQTIDTRGGSLKPLWRSYVEGRPDAWRSYYDARPTFGVNTTNVWKRLLPQVMNKGRLFKGWRSKLYVVVQDSVFQFISRRMPLQQLTRQERETAEIVWVRWDYTGDVDEDGQLVTELAESLYTTLEQVETAFVTINSMQRPDFVAAVQAKRKRDQSRRSPRAAVEHDETLVDKSGEDASEEDV
jgi:hypothetical protein